MDIKLIVPKLRFGGFKDVWQEKKLGEIVRYTKGFAFKSASYKQSGVRIVRASDLGPTYIKRDNKKIFIDPDEDISFKRYELKKGDIIITTVGSRPEMIESAVGRGIYVYKDNEGLLNQNMLKIEPTVGVNTQFIFSFINTAQYIEHIKAIKRGNANQANITVKDLLDYRISYTSVEEQEKIARFLGVVDDKISGLQSKKEQLEKYKKGIMQAHFSGKLRFKDENGNDFPEWRKVTLGEIGKTYNGLTSKTANDFGDGYPFVTYKQIFDNSTIDKNRFAFVKISPYEKQNMAKRGDIFFTTSSETPFEVGFASVLLDDIDNLYLNSFCFGYRINSQNTLSSEFAKFLFRSPSFRRLIIKLAQGSTRFNMSKNELMKISINLPVINEQQKIADFLTVFDDKIRLEERKLAHAKNFKKALLQGMFV